MTTQAGNDAAALAAGVPAPVTVPRSPVPTGADTPLNGHVPGNGTAGTGHVPGSADGSKRRFLIFPPKNDGGHGTGNGHEERSRVPVPTVPPAADEPTPEAAEATEEKPAKVKKRRNWRLFAMWAAIIVMTAMTTLLASSGQIDGTWKWAGLVTTDWRRFLLPGSTEFAVIGFLLIGQYALSKDQKPFMWWRIAAVFAVLAVLMNSVHGDTGHKIQQALIFGGASAASLVMWFAKFWIDYLDVRKRKGQIAGLRPKVWTFGAIRFVPLAWRADLIVARCDQVETRAEAYRLAELWRMVFQDVCAQDGQDRKIARRTAWYTVYQELGVKVIQPKGLKLATVDFAPPPPPPPVQTPAPVMPPRQPRATNQAPSAGAPVPPPEKPRNEAPDPESPSDKDKISVAKPVPDHFWVDHKDHIVKVKAEMPDWASRKKDPTVNEIQTIIGNRTNAANTAACIRVLRSQAAASSN